VTAIIGGIGVGQTAVVAEVLQIASPQAIPAWTKTSNSLEVETSILRDAINNVEAQLLKLATASEQDSAEILDALVELLIDDALFEQARAELELGWAAGAAFGKAVNVYCELLSGDPVFEERSLDLQDLSNRVQAAIAGIELTIDIPATGSFVLVANDFSPADTSQFGASVVGVITAAGGPTSHTSIICRSKGIPALVAAKESLALVSGTSVLLDPLGNRAVIGGLIEEATLSIEYVARLENPVIGVRANIGSLEDALLAGKTSATGVGLLRTELLYLKNSNEPSVEAQITDYSEIFLASPNGPVIVRTFDPEGDKPVPFLALEQVAKVKNYRVLSHYREVLSRQLEAVEAARKETNREVWVMAPLIGSASEALEFASLARSSGDFKVGVMVEQLSLVPELARLEGQIDFLSVGTNDLAQSLFDFDRQNLSNPDLLDPWQPEFLAVLEEIAKQARTANIPVSVCGEVAANPAFALVLAELGFDSVSVAPSQVAAVTSALRS
jgi:phosphotransferase system enzyme I (PtsI)